MAANEPKVVYERTRLTFIANVIEPLGWHDAFRVTTPHGVFQMTKAEFYRDFPNVVESSSYRTGTAAANHGGGYYHYYKVPNKAYKYRIDKEATPRKRTYNPAVFSRPVSDEERRFLEECSNSPEPIVRKRCQVILESLQGKRLREIASSTGYSYITVRVMVRDFNEQGLDSIWRYKRKPRTSS